MLTSLAARIVVGFFFFFAFFVGFWVAGSSLHDPDTCWLLAVGNWIFENHRVPSIDPYSYTMGERPFIAYQWLTELLFFAAYKLLGGYGLVALTNCILVFAFIIIPLKLFGKWKSSMWAGTTACVVAVMSAAFHFLARPEIITYLFLAIWFALLADLRRVQANAATAGGGDDSAKKFGVNWRLAGSFALLMVFWANMHTGFVLALIALATFVLVNTIEFAIRRFPMAALCTAWAALILSVVATLVNPYGIGLWQYLPVLFFPRLNRYIVELKPLGLNGLMEVEFLPSLILAALVIAAQMWDLKRSLKGGKLPVGVAFSPVLTIAALVGGTVSRRIIPFSCVFLACELAWLLRGTWQAAVIGKTEKSANEKPDAGNEAAIDGETAIENESGKNHRWWHDLSDKVGSLLSSGTWPQVVLVLSLFGVFVISTRVMAPDVPQESVAFAAPFEGIKFLAKSAPGGRCLNDPQFGDMMIWYLHTDVEPLFVKDPKRIDGVKRKPNVFIDTRFDMYGSTIVEDYKVICDTEPGWRERFDKYKFDWAFLPPASKIAKVLIAEGWKPIFNDDSAVVLVK